MNFPGAPFIESERLSLLSERGLGLPWPEPPPPDFIEFFREISLLRRFPLEIRDDLLWVPESIPPPGLLSIFLPYIPEIE